MFHRFYKRSFIFIGFILLFFLSQLKAFAAVNWKSTTPLPKRVAPYHAVAFDPDRENIFVIGGRVADYGEKPSKEVFKGSFNSDLSIKWTKQKNYPFKMKNSAAVYLDGYVYNIGGEDPRSKKVYKTDVRDGNISSWERIKSLPNQSWRGQALVYQNKIYYLDGISGKIWRLNRQETQWNKVGSLPKKNFGDFAAAFAPSKRGNVDYLYLTGGQSFSPRCQFNKIYKADVRTSDGKVLGFARAGNFPDKFYPDPFNNDADLDHGIKAYHQIAVNDGKMFVFPAASFATQNSCPTGKTNTGSTTRSFVADITYDGRVINWRVWGPGREGISNIKIDGQYVNHWSGGFDGLNWNRNGLATNVYGGIKYSNYFFMIGGENYAAHSNQVAYIPLKKKGISCQQCFSGIPKSKGNADCNTKINTLDFTEWREVFAGEGDDKGKVDFNCDDSGTSQVDLVDFKIWLDYFMNN
jgi:hypothetical protein